MQLSVAGLAVLAACVLWGIDNNLTRELESMPASLLACLKGWIAGTINMALALALFRSHVTAFQVSGVLAVGALSYGASRVLFFMLCGRSHPHVHDEHHQHAHAAGECQGMHDHFHFPEPLAHAHVHLPDVHHRHDHRASDGTWRVCVLL